MDNKPHNKNKNVNQKKNNNNYHCLQINEGHGRNAHQEVLVKLGNLILRFGEFIFSSYIFLRNFKSHFRFFPGQLSNLFVTDSIL
jgi:hypothetical protein